MGRADHHRLFEPLWSFLFFVHDFKIGVLTHCWEPCQAEPHSLTFINIMFNIIVLQWHKRWLENNFPHLTDTLQAMWPETPHKPVPRFPAVCEKNVFRFFRFSASGKPHLKLIHSNLNLAYFENGSLYNEALKECIILFFHTSVLQQARHIHLTFKLCTNILRLPSLKIM